MSCKSSMSHRKHFTSKELPQRWRLPSPFLLLLVRTESVPTRLREDVTMRTSILTLRAHPAGTLCPGGFHTGDAAQRRKDAEDAACVGLVESWTRCRRRPNERVWVCSTCAPNTPRAAHVT